MAATDTTINRVECTSLHPMYIVKRLFLCKYQVNLAESVLVKLKQLAIFAFVGIVEVSYTV